MENGFIFFTTGLLDLRRRIPNFAEEKTDNCPKLVGRVCMQLLT